MSYNAEILERILSIPFLCLQTQNHHHAPVHTLSTRDDRIYSMPLCLDQTLIHQLSRTVFPIQTQLSSSRTTISSSAWRTSRTTRIPSATRPSLPLTTSKPRSLLVSPPMAAWPRIGRLSGLTCRLEIACHKSAPHELVSGVVPFRRCRGLLAFDAASSHEPNSIISSVVILISSSRLLLT